MSDGEKMHIWDADWTKDYSTVFLQYLGQTDRGYSCVNLDEPLSLWLQ